MVIACILLNRTTGRAVRNVIYKLFLKYPKPRDMITSADQIAEISSIIRPLGLIKRAEYIYTFTLQFVQGCWKSPVELKGIGKYAEDAYRIFCCGDYKDVEPQDHALNKYHQWIMSRNDDDDMDVSQDELRWAAHLNHEEMNDEEKEWWQSIKEMRTDFASRMINLKTI